MKIHPDGAELFHVDGQTDMAKLTVALSKSCLNEIRSFRKAFRTV
jgi:hypothetical protein